MNPVDFEALNERVIARLFELQQTNSSDVRLADIHTNDHVRLALWGCPAKFRNTMVLSWRERWARHRPTKGFGCPTCDAYAERVNYGSSDICPDAHSVLTEIGVPV